MQHLAASNQISTQQKILVNGKQAIQTVKNCHRIRDVPQEKLFGLAE